MFQVSYTFKKAEDRVVHLHVLTKKIGGNDLNTMAKENPDDVEMGHAKHTERRWTWAY